jgi:hypothetical protein
MMSDADADPDTGDDKDDTTQPDLEPVGIWRWLET